LGIQLFYKHFARELLWQILEHDGRVVFSRSPFIF
jgi:hypothetical protein